MAAQNNPDRGPTTVGPYSLCYELGSGGMATVHLGHRDVEGVGRFAAVKVLHPHLAADRTFAEMFLDEAEIISRVRHLNVCTVYDFEMRPGASYIAMEYLVGHSMGAVYKRLVKQPPERVLRNARLSAKVLADACQGLHAAHELEGDDGEPLGVVHRDISPGNLMLTFEGVAKVLDFGVAGAAHKRHRTETGVVKGKLSYIAPELLRGHRADPRADVWGLGVVAWELVTGKRLFHEPNEIDTLRAVMDAQIDPPSVVRPELPIEIDAIVMRALARNSDERYASARDLGRDLARFANRDDVVTSADLAQWLDELFVGSRQRKQETLENALRTLGTPARASASPAVVELHADESGPHGPIRDTALVRGPEARPSSMPPPHADAAPAELYGGVTPARTPLPRTALDDRMRRRAPVLVALAAGAIGGALAVSAFQTTPAVAHAPALAASLPPAAAVPAPAPAIAPSGPRAYVVELVGTDGDAITLRLRPAGSPEEADGVSSVEPDAQ